MKFKSLILLSSIGFTTLAFAQATSPYVILGCTLDTTSNFPQYITSSVTYGSNGGHLLPYNHISCGQNLEKAQSIYEIINVNSVGNEIVYTLKYKNG